MKRKDRKQIAALRIHAAPGDLKELYPNLAEFMTAALFEGDDETRESPTLTVWAAGGLWKASVKDRAEGLIMWLSAESVTELLSLLEDMVLNPEAPWRHDDPAHERNGKRAKKSS